MKSKMLLALFASLFFVERIQAMQIVLPPACGEKAHRIAAKELARYWQEICGEKLAIVSAATEAKAIRFAALPPAKDGLDAYRMKSDEKGLELAAVNGRCALYAVYDFLEQALADYSRAIELDPNLAEAYYNRGLVRLAQKQQELAISDLSKAGELGLYTAYSIIKRARK